MTPSIAAVPLGEQGTLVCRDLRATCEESCLLVTRQSLLFPSVRGVEAVIVLITLSVEGFLCYATSGDHTSAVTASLEALSLRTNQPLVVQSWDLQPRTLHHLYPLLG